METKVGVGLRAAREVYFLERGGAGGEAEVSVRQWSRCSQPSRLSLVPHSRKTVTSHGKKNVLHLQHVRKNAAICESELPTVQETGE